MLTRNAFVLMFLAALGCTEGQKPAPLQRAAGTKASEVAVKPPDNPSSEASAPKGPSLYERLGKEPAIVQVVDDFVANVVADENIKERHKKHFMEGDVALLKRKLVDQIGEATGGPQKYTGKSMAESHSHLKINAKEWDAFMDDLQQTLDKFAVPAEEQAEVKAIVNSTRADIVVDSATVLGHVA